MSDYKEQNYWPGFVDALSNVVLTLVFVLVVFVFALVFSSDKLRKRATNLAAEIQRQEEQQVEIQEEKRDIARENREIRAQLQAAQARVETLETETLRLKRDLASAQSKAEAAQSQVEQGNLLKERTEIKVVAEPEAGITGTAEMEGGSGAIVLIFPRNVFKLDDKAKAALDAALRDKKAFLHGALSSVLSIMGAETYSEGRRLAYFRGLTVRNYLIEQGLGDGKTIHVMIEQGKETRDGRVEIRFRQP